MGLAFTDGKLFFSKEFPELYLAAPEVYAAADQLVIKLHLHGPIAKSGIPEKMLDQMDTWLAAISLLSVQFNELGLKGSHGPEEILRQQFLAAHKPIGAGRPMARGLGVVAGARLPVRGGAGLGRRR